MRADFYPKLAWTGIRKNRRMYLPYLLTCVGMVMMYYMILFLSKTNLLDYMSGGATLRAMMGFGSWIIAIFAVIFLFYTNSFLVRRRKKEFGLYNILGMGKHNIGRILFWETLIGSFASLAVGLGLGIAFSKFAELGLANIIGGRIDYHFYIAGDAVWQTIFLFTVMFLLILANGLRQVHTANPVALLHSENAGEKPPRANWLFGLLGAVLLAAAYVLAVSIRDPLSALAWFFVAVAMVICGTYLLFVAGSVLICRLLQKKKNYYYTANHFVSVSSMSYRMKRNGAGLASICILATMVLVMITGSACLYFGTEDSLHAQYPHDISIEAELQNLSDMSSASQSAYQTRVEQVFQSQHMSPSADAQVYSLVNGLCIIRDGVLQPDGQVTDVFDSAESDSAFRVYFLSLSDYNRAMGEHKTLAPDEILLYTVHCSYDAPTLTIKDGVTFRVAGTVDRFAQSNDMSLDMIPSIGIVLPESEKTLSPLMEYRNKKGGRVLRLSWHYGADFSEPKAEQLALYQKLSKTLSFANTKEEEGDDSFSVRSLEANRSDFYAAYGGIFFLGIMLSIVFILATVLMIYYKQISEGYEDQSRFEIMQKIGMTKRNIRKSINSQMLTVFFLPLAAAVIHLAFAFPMIRKLLLLFNLRNFPLLLITAGASILVFTLLYTMVYRWTSNAYYAIVSGAKEK